MNAERDGERCGPARVVDGAAAEPHGGAGGDGGDHEPAGSAGRSAVPRRRAVLGRFDVRNFDVTDDDVASARRDRLADRGTSDGR